ncbi:receptor-like serine/threonine-protein kinase At1g78530 [Cryptomeria japonica]|uniref:receptor-like serine/threonine-protein kinase At1g78530 n=1 Tax=Cryptomeria japonica TaxID=3369 RepID=UPI0027DA200A|nr:receptor-like serine/threonine-protein kinase At1g78530 [Cryptomeria japonica]
MRKSVRILLAIYLISCAISLIISWKLYYLHLVLRAFPLFTTIVFVSSFVLLFSVFLQPYINRNRNRVSDFETLEAKIQRISQPYLKTTQQDLVEATANFSDRKIIGKGRFGTVYRGILGNGQTVAIKRMELSEDRQCCLEHFLSELEILGGLRHRNLMRILGYFFNGQEMIIVSKFMANFSLDVLLHGPLDCRLDWKQRLNIAVGVAHGLAYLHHDCKNTIVHCDLKPANILVDEHLEAHIADFGVARIMNNNEVTPSSLGFCFTIGYTAPERAYQLRWSPKADIYSFGVVLLELISGIKPTNSSLLDKGLALPQWAAKVQMENNLTELIDDCLKNIYKDKQVYVEMERILKLGIICTHENPKIRPDMKDVVHILTDIKQRNRKFNIPISVLAEQEFQYYEILTDSSISV